MPIILKENKWASEVITQKTLGKKPSETLRRIARYYLDQGLSKKEVRDKLEAFVVECDPSASIPRWSDSLDYAMSRALKTPAVDIDHVVITKNELEKIDLIEGRQSKRLMFTLLCLAKYWDIVNSKASHWVNTKDSEIMSMANINTSIKRQSQMYAALNQAGLIGFSKKIDNTNVQVLMMEDGDPALYIHDFRNLGYQYLKYCGEPYIECCYCGLTTKKVNTKSNNQKYCPECSVKIALQQRVNSVMKKRLPPFNN